VGQSGIYVAFVYLVGGVAIGLLSGSLGDKVMETRKNGRMLLAAGFALISVPFWYIGMTQPEGAVMVTWACFALGFGTLNAYYGLVYSAIQDIVGAAQRGFAMALYFMAMYVCGAAFGPILTGTVSDRLARAAMAQAGASQLTDQFRAVGLQQAMLAVPIVALLLALVLWLGSRTIEADMARRAA
jgi:MFS family permease